MLTPAPAAKFAAAALNVMAGPQDAPQALFARCAAATAVTAGSRIWTG